MKITIVLEHDDSDTCLVYETDDFQQAIDALNSWVDVSLRRHAAQLSVKRTAKKRGKKSAQEKGE